MKLINLQFLCSVLILITACSKTQKSSNPILVTDLWTKEQTSHNNYRIPALIVSKQQTLLAFSEGRESGDAGNIDILLKRSLDNGETWEEQHVVWDDAENTCGNPCPVVDQATGRIYLFMTWNLGSDAEHDILRKKSKNTRVPYLCYSDDEGLTWTTPENMLRSCKNDAWGWYATGPGVGIQLTSDKYNGRLVIPANHSYDDPENTTMEGFEYGAHVLLSDDGGESWRMSESITPKVNESQVVELEDGRLLLNMRSYHGKSSRAISTSSDGGETWTEVSHDLQLIEPVCQASLINYGALNGEQLYLFSNPAVNTSRTHMTIKSSFDDCATWSNSKLIYAGPSAYSSLTRLPNGNIGLLFECGALNPYEKITFVSLEPEELYISGSVISSKKIALKITPALELTENKSQIDTVSYVEFNTDGDDYYLTTNKNGKEMSFVYNKEDIALKPYTQNDILQVTYSMDSVSMAGDEEVVYLLAVAKTVVKIGEKPKNETVNKDTLTVKIDENFIYSLVKNEKTIDATTLTPFHIKANDHSVYYTIENFNNSNFRFVLEYYESESTAYLTSKDMAEPFVVYYTNDEGCWQTTSVLKNSIIEKEEYDCGRENEIERSRYKIFPNGEIKKIH